MQQLSSCDTAPVCGRSSALGRWAAVARPCSPGASAGSRPPVSVRRRGPAPAVPAPRCHDQIVRAGLEDTTGPRHTLAALVEEKLARSPWRSPW